MLLRFCSAAAQVKLNNVLVVMADDMSAFYLGKNHPVKMPNLKRLASRGTECINAHSAIPVCGPSRMSILSGRHPDSSKLWTFERQLPQVSNLKTVAQYLASNYGYETISFGKVTHEDSHPSDARALGQYQSGMWTEQQQGGGSKDTECGVQWFCKKPERKLGDFQLSRRIESYLKHRNASRPFLAFVGFRKPHLTVAVPSTWLRRGTHGTDSVATNTLPSLGQGGKVIPFSQSLQRFECYSELKNRRIKKLKAFPAGKLLVPRKAKTLRTIRSYYFTAINWVDSLLGYVMDVVDKHPIYSENTAIVFISDHGFAMGEHSLFCKNALFDQQTRVPFVAAPAKRDDAIRGVVRTEPVSLVDLFPTVVQLAVGVNLPSQAVVDNSGIPIDGRSVLSSKEKISTYTFSVYPRCTAVSAKSNWQCVVGTSPCSRRKNIFMGYAVRTETARYVEWRHFNDAFTKCEAPDYPGLLPRTRARMTSVWQIDLAKTGTIWSLLPAQREMFENYPSTVDFTWGDWEKGNVLVDRLGNGDDIAIAHEMSSAIRWRFDPSFTGQTSQPCSGNGWVRLVDRSLWTKFEPDRQPEFADIRCECLTGWKGALCQEVDE